MACTESIAKNVELLITKGHESTFGGGNLDIALERARKYNRDNFNGIPVISWQASKTSREGLIEPVVSSEQKQRLLDAIYERDVALENQQAQRDIDASAIQAGIDNNEYLYSPQEATQEVGEDYITFVQYKEDQLAAAEKAKRTLEHQLQYQTDPIKRDQLRDIKMEMRLLEKQLSQLAENKVEYMFEAINYDLEELAMALATTNVIHDIETVRDKLNFYDDFVDALDDHAEYGEIAGTVRRLLNSQEEALQDKLKNLLNEDIRIQATMRNLNSGDARSKAAKKQLGRAPDYEITVEDLLIAKKDLNTVESKTLGVMSSTTGEGIIPEYLQNKFQDTLQDKTAKVQEFVTRLSVAAKELASSTREDFYALDSDGNKNGFLEGVFSNEWYSALAGRGNLMSMLRSDPKIAYSKLVAWHKKNTDIVDFTKIKAIQDIYGDNPNYKWHFESNDADMSAYETELRQKLGPNFDSTIEEIKARLLNFENFRNDASGNFAQKNIAARNLWDFNKSYSKDTNPEHNRFKYTAEDGNEIETTTRFMSFKDLVFIPKTQTETTTTTPLGRTTKTINSGYYSDRFQSIKNDPKKLAYWQAAKEMSEYVGSVYGEESHGRVSFPKIDLEVMESLILDFDAVRKGQFGRLGKMLSDSARAYKSTFFNKTSKDNTEKDQVTSNQSDHSKAEISRLTEVYMIKGMPKSEARQKATGEVLDNYSGSLDRNLKAWVIEAAMHEARLDVAPIAKNMLDLHSSQLDANGETRKKSVERLEHYINKIILNKSIENSGLGAKLNKDLHKISFLSTTLNQLDQVFTKKKTKVGDEIQGRKLKHLMKWTSKADRRIISELKLLGKNGNPAAEYSFVYEGIGFQKIKDVDTGVTTYHANDKIVNATQFEHAFGKFLKDKIDNTGIGLNMVGIVGGILNTIIYKTLMLSGASGMFNRLEGKNSSLFMDMTGEYWSPGNIDYANDFLGFANAIKISNRFLDPTMTSKGTKIKIFQELLGKLGSLQDRKNEQQRQEDKSQFNTSFLNPFAFAVENPEFKNQGAIILALMADTNVKDNSGNEVPFWDKETGSFSAFQLVNGELNIRPEFSDNVEFGSDMMKGLTAKVENAVSHSQGNYSDNDATLMKSNVWGRAGTMFMTWFPEHFNQRWGTREQAGELNINLTTGKRKALGRNVQTYKASPLTGAVQAIGLLGVSYGMLGIVGAVGGGAIVALGATKMLKNMNRIERLPRDIDHIKVLGNFIHSTLLETVSYPARVGSALPGFKKMKFRNSEVNKNSIGNAGFANTGLTPEEVGAIKATARELAVALNVLAVKVAALALLHPDDDEDEKTRLVQFSNYVQNFTTRMITSISIWTDPSTILSDHTNIAFVTQLHNMMLLMTQITSGDYGKAGKTTKKLIAPKIIKDLMSENPFLTAEYNYDEMRTLTGMAKPLAYVPKIKKSINSGGGVFKKGESDYRKLYNDLKKERREEIDNSFRAEGYTSKEEIRTMRNAQMKDEFPKVSGGLYSLAYKDYLDNKEILDAQK